MPKSYKINIFIKRVLSWLIIVLLNFEQVALAAPMAKPMASKPIESRLNIPQSIATIDEVYVSDSPKKIFLVKDAHINSSAQLNISKAIEHIVKKESVEIVFLEGAKGDSSWSFLHENSDLKDRQKVAHSYLMKNKIQGAEHFNISTNHKVELWGVEDMDLYWDSLDGYRKVYQSRNKLKKYLSEIKSTVNSLRYVLLNQELLSFSDIKNKYQSKKISVGEYQNTLLRQARALNINLNNYPNLKMIQQINRLESKIDFKLASNQQQKIISLLSEKETESFKELTGGNSKWDVLFGSYDAKSNIYALLEEKIKNSKNHFHFNEFLKYTKYIKLIKNLEKDVVFNEQVLVEKKVIDELSIHPDEKEFLLIEEKIKWLEKLLDLRVMSEEVNILLRNKFDYKAKSITGFLNKKIMDIEDKYEKSLFIHEEFDQFIENAIYFYNKTIVRDKHFVKEINRKMESNSTSKAIFVVGGYHINHLKKILKSQRISYEVIQPQVFHETNHRKYEEILLSQDRSDLQVFALTNESVNTINTIPGRHNLSTVRSIQRDLGSKGRLAEAAARLASDLNRVPSFLKLEDTSDINELAYDLGLDIRSAESGLLHPLYIGHNESIRRALNPNRKRGLVGIYGASGVDVSNFLLSTDVTHGYFVDKAPSPNPEELEHWLSLWDEIESYVETPSVDMSKYLEWKYKLGYAPSDSPGLDAKEASLILELKSIGVPKDSIRFRRVGGGTTEIEFKWSHSGEDKDLNDYTITFVNADIETPSNYPSVLTDLKGKVDIYYQRAGYEISHHFESYLDELGSYIKKDGFVAVDSHYLDHDGLEEVYRYQNPKPHLSSFKPIDLEASKASQAFGQNIIGYREKLMEEPHDGNLHYGWDVEIYQNAAARLSYTFPPIVVLAYDIVNQIDSLGGYETTAAEVSALREFVDLLIDDARVREFLTEHTDNDYEELREGWVKSQEALRVSGDTLPAEIDRDKLVMQVRLVLGAYGILGTLETESDNPTPEENMEEAIGKIEKAKAITDGLDLPEKERTAILAAYTLALPANEFIGNDKKGIKGRDREYAEVLRRRPDIIKPDQLELVARVMVTVMMGGALRVGPIRLTSSQQLFELVYKELAPIGATGLSQDEFLSNVLDVHYQIARDEFIGEEGLYRNQLPELLMLMQQMFLVEDDLPYASVVRSHLLNQYHVRAFDRVRQWIEERGISHRTVGYDYGGADVVTPLLMTNAEEIRIRDLLSFTKEDGPGAEELERLKKVYFIHHARSGYVYTEILWAIGSAEPIIYWGLEALGATDVKSPRKGEVSNDEDPNSYYIEFNWSHTGDPGDSKPRKIVYTQEPITEDNTIRNPGQTVQSDIYFRKAALKTNVPLHQIPHEAELVITFSENRALGGYDRHGAAEVLGDTPRASEDSLSLDSTQGYSNILDGAFFVRKEEAEAPVEKKSTWSVGDVIQPTDISGNEQGDPKVIGKVDEGEEKVWFFKEGDSGELENSSVSFGMIEMGVRYKVVKRQSGARLAKQLSDGAFANIFGKTRAQKTLRSIFDSLGKFPQKLNRKVQQISGSNYAVPFEVSNDGKEILWDLIKIQLYNVNPDIVEQSSGNDMIGPNAKVLTKKVKYGGRDVYRPYGILFIVKANGNQMPMFIDISQIYSNSKTPQRDLIDERRGNYDLATQAAKRLYKDGLLAFMQLQKYVRKMDSERNFGVQWLPYTEVPHSEREGADNWVMLGFTSFIPDAQNGDPFETYTERGTLFDHNDKDATLDYQRTLIDIADNIPEVLEGREVGIIGFGSGVDIPYVHNAGASAIHATEKSFINYHLGLWNVQHWRDVRQIPEAYPITLEYKSGFPTSASIKTVVFNTPQVGRNRQELSRTKRAGFSANVPHVIAMSIEVDEFKQIAEEMARFTQQDGNYAVFRLTPEPDSGLYEGAPGELIAQYVDRHPADAERFQMLFQQDGITPWPGAEDSILHLVVANAYLDSLDQNSFAHLSKLFFLLGSKGPIAEEVIQRATEVTWLGFSNEQMVQTGLLKHQVPMSEAATVEDMLAGFVEALLDQNPMGLSVNDLHRIIAGGEGPQNIGDSVWSVGDVLQPVDSLGNPQGVPKVIGRVEVNERKVWFYSDSGELEIGSVSFSMLDINYQVVRRGEAARLASNVIGLGLEGLRDEELEIRVREINRQMDAYRRLGDIHSFSLRSDATMDVGVGKVNLWNPVEYLLMRRTGYKNSSLYTGGYVPIPFTQEDGKKVPAIYKVAREGAFSKESLQRLTLDEIEEQMELEIVSKRDNSPLTIKGFVREDSVFATRTARVFTVPGPHTILIDSKTGKVIENRAQLESLAVDASVDDVSELSLSSLVSALEEKRAVDRRYSAAIDFKGTGARWDVEQFFEAHLLGEESRLGLAGKYLAVVPPFKQQAGSSWGDGFGFDGRSVDEDLRKRQDRLVSLREDSINHWTSVVHPIRDDNYFSVRIVWDTTLSFEEVKNPGTWLTFKRLLKDRYGSEVPATKKEIVEWYLLKFGEEAILNANVLADAKLIQPGGLTPGNFGAFGRHRDLGFTNYRGRERDQISISSTRHMILGAVDSMLPNESKATRDGIRQKVDDGLTAARLSSDEIGWNEADVVKVENDLRDHGLNSGKFKKDVGRVAGRKWVMPVHEHIETGIRIIQKQFRYTTPTRIRKLIALRKSDAYFRNGIVPLFLDPNKGMGYYFFEMDLREAGYKNLFHILDHKVSPGQDFEPLRDQARELQQQGTEIGQWVEERASLNHGHLRSDNMMVNRHGNVSVIDWSIVRDYTPNEGARLSSEFLLEALGLNADFTEELKDVPEIAGVSVRRITVPERQNPLEVPQGLEILDNELYPTREFDLLYREGRLIAVFPIFDLEEMLASALLLKAPEPWSFGGIPHYFDLSDYYFDVPRYDDSWDGERVLGEWKDLAERLKVDKAVIKKYKDDVLSENDGPFHAALTPVDLNLKHSKYVYVELTENNEVAVIQGFSAFEYGKYHKHFARKPGVNQIIFPIYPTVYDPSIPEHIISAQQSIKILADKPEFGLREGHEVVVFGPGSGIDTWVTNLITKRKVAIKGKNPLEDANTRETARIAGFEVEVLDEVDRAFDRVIWDMPEYTPQLIQTDLSGDFDMATLDEEPLLSFKRRRLRSFWDHDIEGETLIAFAKTLRSILNEDGRAALWNDNHVRSAVIIDILATGGEVHSGVQVHDIYTAGFIILDDPDRPYVKTTYIVSHFNPDKPEEESSSSERPKKGDKFEDVIKGQVKTVDEVRINDDDSFSVRFEGESSWTKDTFLAVRYTPVGARLVDNEIRFIAEVDLAIGIEDGVKMALDDLVLKFERDDENHLLVYGLFEDENQPIRIEARDIVMDERNKPKEATISMMDIQMIFEIAEKQANDLLVGVPSLDTPKVVVLHVDGLTEGRGQYRLARIQSIIRELESLSSDTIILLEGSRNNIDLWVQNETRPGLFATKLQGDENQLQQVHIAASQDNVQSKASKQKGHKWVVLESSKDDLASIYSFSSLLDYVEILAEINEDKLEGSDALVQAAFRLFKMFSGDKAGAISFNQFTQIVTDPEKAFEYPLSPLVRIDLNKAIRFYQMLKRMTGQSA